MGLSFNEAIKECREANFITDRTASLTSVVRDFRNLIHPGRMKRLAEKIDGNSAQVAISLVEMTIEEVRERKRSVYGLTAEQLVAQLERDLNVIKVLGHFTSDMQEIELERLLLKINPERYFELLNEEPDPYIDEILVALQKCYHQVFDSVSEDVKTKVMHKYIRILKTEGSHTIDIYEDVFYKNDYLTFISSELDRKFIKDRLFGLISDVRDLGQLSHKFTNIGFYLDDDEATNFTRRALDSYLREGTRRPILDLGQLLHNERASENQRPQVGLKRS